MMKRVIFIVITTIVFSCLSDDRYEEYNIDPNNPSTVDANFLFNSGFISLVNIQTDPNIFLNIGRLMSQYWATTTYPQESNYILNFSNTNGNYWDVINTAVLKDLKSAKELVGLDNTLTLDQQSTRIAQAEVLMIYAWQVLVDTYGNIPYSQALDIDSFPLPAYDDAATIYQDLIVRIDNAIANLNGQGFEIDNLYFGDISAWKTFAASLKLRLGIRLTDVNPSLAQATVENAFNNGVFTSNQDNAVLWYPGGPNPNPIWTDIVQSGRQDFVSANTIIDIMNSLDDPRRAVYFQENLGPNVYEGGIYGDFNFYDSYSHIGTTVLEPEFPGVLLSYSEVSFYLAEAAARGYAVGDAEAHYNNGIIASFDEWETADVNSYLLNADVAYTTAPGDWRQKIGTQFWLAMYNRGYEGWTAWRTYDAPQLNSPALTGNPVPFRHRYPIQEQNLNETNWENASQAIGGDEQTTKLFWDMY